MKLKIWHVGGEDVHMRIPLLLLLRESGMEVAAVGNADGQQFEGTGIRYFRYPLSRWINPWQDIGSVRVLAGLIRRERPDIVHGFDTKPSLIAPVTAALAGHCKSVRTINGMGYLFSETNMKTRAIRPAYHLAQSVVRRLCSHTIFQNSDDMAYFQDHRLINSNSSSLIRGSGIDTDQLIRDSCPQGVSALRQEFSLEGNLVITMIARLVKSKGVEEYLIAARELRRQYHGLKFILVGPRSTEGDQAIAQSMLDEFAEDVILTGPRRDIPDILAASDLFVLPSYYREGVPRSLLEAAAVGLPLVATDMPGCRDVVQEGVNGVLVQTRSADALACGIGKIIADLPAWRENARGHRNQIRCDFGIERVAAQHKALYRQLHGLPR